MAYYVRKIARAKWSSKECKNIESIFEYRADAIANDMRTTNDTLSFWKVDNLTQECLEPVIVINSLLGDTITRIDLICVPEERVSTFAFEQEDGDTVVQNYKKLHYNLVSLTVKSLLDFSEDVVLPILNEEEIKANDPTHEALIIRIAQPRQLQLVAQWIDKGEIAFEDLKEKQKEAIGKYRNKHKIS